MMFEAARFRPSSVIRGKDSTCVWRGPLPLQPSSRFRVGRTRNLGRPADDALMARRSRQVIEFGLL